MRSLYVRFGGNRWLQALPSHSCVDAQIVTNWIWWKVWWKWVLLFFVAKDIKRCKYEAEVCDQLRFQLVHCWLLALWWAMLFQWTRLPNLYGWRLEHVSNMYMSYIIRSHCPSSSRIPMDTYLGLSENVGYIPNEIAIFHRDNGQQNHWVFRGLAYFQ